MKKFVATITLLLNIGWAFTQSPVIIKEQFQWESSPDLISLGKEQLERWGFRGGVSSSEHPGLLFFVKRFPVEGYGQLRVEVLEARYEPFEMSTSGEDAFLLCIGQLFYRPVPVHHPFQQSHTKRPHRGRPPIRGF